MEIKVDMGGAIELAIFLTLVLAAGNLLKLWAPISWWWVASPLLALVVGWFLFIIISLVAIIIKVSINKRG